MQPKISSGILRVIFPAIFFAAISCGKNLSYQAPQNPAPLTIDETIPPDRNLSEFIAPYKDSLAKVMDEVLVTSAWAHEKTLPEGILGNLVADIVLEKGNRFLLQNNQDPADFSVLNNGGLRAPLPAGKVSVRNVYELMPFENSLSVLTLSGAVTDTLLHYVAAAGGVPVSGIRMEIKNKKPVNVFIGNKPFDESKNYRVITSDYLANGGDKMYFFSNAEERKDIQIKIRDILLRALKEKGIQGEKLAVEKDGRIIIK